MKRFDPWAKLYYEYKLAKKECQAAGRAHRAAEKKEKKAKEALLKKLGTSTVASIGGKPAFRKNKAGRESATVERVKKNLPPSLWGRVIEYVTWDVIEFLDEEE